MTEHPARAFEGLTSDDDTEFRGFVASRWNALVATAFLVTADRQIAEDCAQEALVGLHRHWRRVTDQGDPAGYARKAALNSALSWRRRRRISEVPLDRLPDVRARLVTVQSLDPDLTAALLTLPPRMRAVVALRFVEDCSEAETAQLLGCSVGTVKSAAHKGLARLRAVLDPGSTGTDSTGTDSKAADTPSPAGGKGMPR